MLGSERLAEANRSLPLPLPLPLAQTLRRAVNATAPADQHLAAYFFFESIMKLAAAAQIGAYAQLGCEDRHLNARPATLVGPTVGQWLGLLRTVSGCRTEREDAADLPLAGLHVRLIQREPRPAGADFLAFAKDNGVGVKPMTILSALDLFEALVMYGNQEIGAGHATRTEEFYARAAPVLLNAVLEALEALRPFDGLSLAVARGASGQGNASAYEVLRVNGSRELLAAKGSHDAHGLAAGRLVLTDATTVIPLHPLVIYEIDEIGQDRVAFLHAVSPEPSDDAPGADEGPRVEYIDYGSGARLTSPGAATALAALVTRLRGREATREDVLKLAHKDKARDAFASALLRLAQAEPAEVSLALEPGSEPESCSAPEPRQEDDGFLERYPLVAFALGVAFFALVSALFISQL
jgi:hypothetical protein